MLPSATIMVVTVTASTTAGQPLSEAGIAAVRAHRDQRTLVPLARILVVTDYSLSLACPNGEA